MLLCWPINIIGVARAQSKKPEALWRHSSLFSAKMFALDLGAHVVLFLWSYELDNEEYVWFNKTKPNIHAQPP